MKNIIVILGQTATGKSDLAVKIAKKLKGEVISADSRQVYKYLDIGTGKISKKEMKGVPHHLIDVVEPKKVFSVSDYKKMAKSKIEEILSKNKIPIICGGTGFYIDTLVNDSNLPEVKPNKKLRKELERKNLNELFEILKNIDKERANTIDPKNKVRLIRAIEIASFLGKVPKVKINKNKDYNFIKIGVKIPKGELEQKITKRVQKMFKDGLLEEIENLKKMKISEKRLREFGFEYFNPTTESVISNTLKYAKRQDTWFKRDKEIKWFDPKDYKKIEGFIKEKIK